jgi:hypothetical protein
MCSSDGFSHFLKPTKLNVDIIFAAVGDIVLRYIITIQAITLLHCTVTLLQVMLPDWAHSLFILHCIFGVFTPVIWTLPNLSATIRVGDDPPTSCLVAGKMPRPQSWWCTLFLYVLSSCGYFVAPRTSCVGYPICLAVKMFYAQHVKWTLFHVQRTNESWS